VPSRSPKCSRSNRRGAEADLGGGWLAHDELRLAPGALQRHDGFPGHGRGPLRAQVAAQHVQAQVERRRRARGGEQLAVVHVQHVRIHLDAGIFDSVIGVWLLLCGASLAPARLA